MTERERLRTTGHYYAISNQNYPKAIETFRELTQKYPADDAAFNNLAVAAFFDRRFDLAFSAGANALDIYPNNSLYQGNLALYAMYSGRFEEAQVRADALLQEQPDYAMAYLALANSAVAEAEFEQANAHYERMAQTGTRGASIAALGKADLATYLGDAQSAIAQLRTAITTDIEHVNLAGTVTKQLALAQLLAASGETEEAEGLAHTALDTATSTRSRFEAGLVFAVSGNTQAAITQVEALKAELSKESRAYGNALEALLAFNDERYAAAMDAIMRGKELADLWWLQYLAGRTYLKIDLYAEAFSEFESCKARIGEASALFLDDLPSWSYYAELEYWLGRAQQGLNMSADALSTYQSFVQRIRGDLSIIADAKTRIDQLESATTEDMP